MPQSVLRTPLFAVTEKELTRPLACGLKSWEAVGRLAAQFDDNAEPKETFSRPECRHTVIQSQPHINITPKKKWHPIKTR